MSRIGLALGSHEARVVVLARSGFGGWRVEHAASLPYPPGVDKIWHEDKALQKVFHQAREEAGAKRASVHLTLTDDLVLTKPLEHPDEASVRRLVDRWCAYPWREAAWVTRNGSGHAATVAVVHRPLLDRFRQAAKAAGVTLETVEGAHRRVSALLPAQSGGLMTLGRSLSTFSVWEQGHVTDLVTSWEGVGATPSLTTLLRVARAVQDAVAAHRRRHDGCRHTWVVTGKGSVIPGLLPLLADTARATLVPLDWPKGLSAGSLTADDLRVFAPAIGAAWVS